MTSLTNAPTGDLGLECPDHHRHADKDGVAVNTPDAIEMKVSTPQFTNTSSFKNHGAYVSSRAAATTRRTPALGCPSTNSKRGRIPPTTQSTEARYGGP